MGAPHHLRAARRLLCLVRVWPGAHIHTNAVGASPVSVDSDLNTDVVSSSGSRTVCFLIASAMLLGRACRRTGRIGRQCMSAKRGVRVALGSALAVARATTCL